MRVARMFHAWVAVPRLDDVVRVAGELVVAGGKVALEHHPAGSGDDAVAEFCALIAGVEAAGLVTDCELTVPVGLGPAAVRTVADVAGAAGLVVVLSGPADLVLGRHRELPTAGVAISARWPGAEQDCRALAAGRVRLCAGRTAEDDLNFVRCLSVLMAGSGRPAVATTDRRLVAIAGERAAWNERRPDSWEYLMPFRIRTDEQQRLTAAGYRVRVAVPSGARLPGGDPAGVLRGLAGHR